MKKDAESKKVFKYIIVYWVKNVNKKYVLSDCDGCVIISGFSDARVIAESVFCGNGFKFADSIYCVRGAKYKIVKI